MRLFFYKSVFIFVSIFFLYKVTIGQLINNYEKKINYTMSQENINEIKSKIRKEIKGSLKKDRILKEEHAKLIKQFLQKIQNEINNTK